MSIKEQSVILDELGKIQRTLGAQTAQLSSIEAQVYKTNGTVRDLVQWRSNIDAITADRKERQEPNKFLDSSTVKIILNIILYLSMGILVAMGAGALIK